MPQYGGAKPTPSSQHSCSFQSVDKPVAMRRRISGHNGSVTTSVADSRNESKPQASNLVIGGDPKTAPTSGPRTRCVRQKHHCIYRMAAMHFWHGRSTMASTRILAQDTPASKIAEGAERAQRIAQSSSLAMVRLRGWHARPANHQRPGDWQLVCADCHRRGRRVPEHTNDQRRTGRLFDDRGLHRVIAPEVRTQLLRNDRGNGRGYRDEIGRGSWRE